MTAERIEVFKPSLGDDELRAVAEVFQRGWIGLGPKTCEFERAFAEYVGARHAIAVNSATAALHLACLVLDVGPGDEVLVPTITFVSTAHAPAYCGAKPVFVDVDPETLNLDPADLQRKITSRTKAVVPVHFGGHACPMDDIWTLAERHNLAVIEDAAHAAGSQYRGQRVGGLERTDLACFSFQAVKNLPVGDGGMITTNRDELVDRLKRLRWVGIDKSTWDRTEEVTAQDESPTRRYSRYGWYYEVHELGYKYHMNDIAAAIGLVQLSKLDAMNRRRRQIARQYTEGLRDVKWLRCPVERPETRSCWHNYVIKSQYRDELNLSLREKRIATGVHYMPLHLQPYYRQCRAADSRIPSAFQAGRAAACSDCETPEARRTTLGAVPPPASETAHGGKAATASLPVAEELWTQLLTLPLYPELTDEQVDYIIRSVRSFEPPKETERGAHREGGRLRRIDAPRHQTAQRTQHEGGQRPGSVRAQQTTPGETHRDDSG